MKRSNEFIITQDLTNVSDDNFEEGNDLYDVNKIYDKSMWPENLLIDIFGLYYYYDSSFKNQISKYIRIEPKVKEITNNVLESIPKNEAKLLQCIYMEGKSIQEIAKQNKKTNKKVIELKRISLRDVRNPKFAKQYSPIFKEINEKIIGKQNHMKEQNKIYKIGNEVKKYKCSACGKVFDIYDYQEDFTFDKLIGYGSKHDEQHISFRLCCNCFDEIFDVIKPMIKDIKIEKYDERYK